MLNNDVRYLGMQHDVILASQPYGLGLNETLMPQYLKQLGYATHAVGKVRNVFGKFVICEMLIKQLLKIENVQLKDITVKI